jgi:hypothetical protein
MRSIDPGIASRGSINDSRSCESNFHRRLEPEGDTLRDLDIRDRHDESASDVLSTMQLELE